MSDHEQRLREIAYGLWVDAGRPHGRSDEFWFTARAMLDAEEASPAEPEPPPTATAPD